MKHLATREPVYESLNALNHDFECVLAELARLHELGMFNRDLANILRIVVKETRAWANFELVEILLQREQDDWTRFAPAVGEEAARPQRRAHRSEAFDGEAGEGGKERRAKAGRGWIGGRMRWRVDSGVAVEDSARCLVLNLCHRQTGVETSLDTARTSACGTMRVSEGEYLAVQPLEAEDEFERARR